MKLRNLLLLAVGIFFLNSCEEDPLGLFSDDVRDRMVGEWSVEETSSLFKKSVNNTYMVTISKDTQDSSVIYIKNFYDLGENVSLKVIVSSIYLTIPSQDLNGGYVSPVSVSGNGSVAWNYKDITLRYNVDLKDGDIDYAIATYTPLK